jgi:ADP-ribose pyrophosphatase YjhB (NUDIX family)
VLDSFDPEAAVADDDIEYVEARVEKDDAHFGFFEPVAGMVAVGVTDSTGALLLVENDAESHALLPFGWVDPDDEWTTVARDRVEELTGLRVELDGVERVRHVEYVHETESRRTEGYLVVFTATPVEDEEVADAGVAYDGETAPTDVRRHDVGVDADWYRTVPETVPDPETADGDDAMLGRDVRSLLE